MLKVHSSQSILLLLLQVAVAAAARNKLQTLP